MVYTDPVTNQGQQQLQTDLENLNQAVEGVKAEEVFIPASSPTNIEAQRRNEYYPTQEFGGGRVRGTTAGG